MRECSGRSCKSCWQWTTGAPACLGSLGASCYSLELDFSLIQKVGVEEPAEKQVQAGGKRRGAAQIDGELQRDVRDTQQARAFFPCPERAKPSAPYTARAAPSSLWSEGSPPGWPALL